MGASAAGSPPESASLGDDGGQLGRLEVWGTFDVANVGDLLYPLVLEYEGRRRGFAGSERWRWVSPTAAGAPFGLARETMAAADDRSRALAGAVYGGGDLVRLEPASSSSLFPGSTGLYRYDHLLAGLTDLARHVPVAWNGVGVPAPFTGAGTDAVRQLCERSTYVSVRDSVSAQYLVDAGFAGDITVVPDPAFLADAVVATDEFDLARSGSRVGPSREGEVLAVHASFLTAPDEAALIHALRQTLATRPGLSIIGVPLGPCHGDVERLQRMASALGTRFDLADSDSLDRLVGSLATADGFIGSSLHGNVLCVRAGVPCAVLTLGGRRPHKVTEMAARFGRPIVESSSDVQDVVTDLLEGRLPVDRCRVEQATAEVAVHYERLFAALRGQVPAVGPAEPTDSVQQAFEDAVASRLDAFNDQLASAIAYGQEAKAAYERAHDHAQQIDRLRLELEATLASRQSPESSGARWYQRLSSRRSSQ